MTADLQEDAFWATMDYADAQSRCALMVLGCAASVTLTGITVGTNPLTYIAVGATCGNALIQCTSLGRMKARMERAKRRFDNATKSASGGGAGGGDAGTGSTSTVVDGSDTIPRSHSPKKDRHGWVEIRDEL